MADAAARAAIRRATLRAQRAVEDLDAGMAQALIDLYSAAADDIAARLMLHAGADDTLSLAEMRSALAQIQARLAALARARDGLLGEALDQAATLGAEAIAGGVATAASMRVSHEALRFIQTFMAEDGLQLSDRVWRLDRQARDRVVNAIEQAVIQGWGAEQAARELLGQGKPVPADLREKAKSADAAALGRQVDELMTGPGSPMDNAMRVMRTEINRAHGEAYMMGGEDHPDFAGWRFLLSPAHPKPDICDLLSAQNLYGLGQGVYPDRERLPWPAHPNTLSFVVIVFKDEVTAADRDGEETPMAALARLSPEQRLGVLGKGKSEVYEAGKLTQGMIRAPLKDVRARTGDASGNDGRRRYADARQLETFYRHAVADSSVEGKLPLGRITNLAAIRTALGKEVFVDEVVAQASCLRHIDAYHGQAGLRRDARAVTPADIILAVSVINSDRSPVFDGRTTHTGNPLLRFEQRIGGITYRVIGEVRAGKRNRNVAVYNLYKR